MVVIGRKSRSRRRPPGIAILAVMLGIFLVGVFGLAMVQSIVQRQRIQRREAQEIQCRFLLHSGLELAAARLARDPEYAGETWQVVARGLEAEIRIEMLAQPAPTPGRRLARVTALYPLHPVARVQLSEQFPIRVDVASNASDSDR